MNLKTIQSLSLKEKKSQLERLAKLCEESGELAQEILINRNASGFDYKLDHGNNIMEEAVDVTLVALSIFFQQGGSPELLTEISQKKCDKWQKHQH